MYTLPNNARRSEPNKLVTNNRQSEKDIKIAKMAVHNELLADVREIMKVKLPAILPYFEPRPPQLNVAIKSILSLERQNNLIAELPTGTGKSIAILVPAILWSITSKKKVIISTATKPLQRQLYDDLPIMAKVFKDFKYAIVLGGDNYLCNARISNVLQLGFFDLGEERDCLQRLLDLQSRKQVATQYDLDFQVPDGLWGRISYDRHICNSACTYRSSCTYLSNLKSQQDAHVLISNHNLTLSHLRMGSSLMDHVGAVIFDECQDVEKVATEVFSIAIDEQDLRRYIEELYNPRSRSGLITKLSLSRHHRNEVEDAVMAINERLIDIQGSLEVGSMDMKEADNALLLELQSALGRLYDCLKKDSIDALMPYVEQIDSFRMKLEKICSRKQKDYVYWKSLTPYGSWSFSMTPIFVADSLRKTLFRPNKIATIHVSATIAVDGDMSFYRDWCGIDDAEEMIEPSPFNYPDQAAIYAPNGMPAPGTKEDYLNAVVKECVNLISFFDGRTLILCTSNDFMQQLSRELADKLPGYNLLRQKDLPDNELIKLFKEKSKSVLVGLNTFWQGINIPGNALKCVILTKIPFGVPTDPITRAREKAMRKKGLNFFNLYYRAKALILWKQAFGRLIRTKDDRGVVAILDPRAKTKYDKLFLKSLPECPIVDSVEAFHNLQL